MAEISNKGLWAAVITGILAIAGTVVGSIIKGVSEINLEKTRLESQLILNALSVDSEEKRRASLQFLVDSSLVRDEATKTGLKKYLDGKDRTSLPQFTPLLQSGETQILTPRTKKNVQFTDIDFFLCGKDKDNRVMNELVVNASNAMRENGMFGESKGKLWEGTLYDEISLTDLKGKTTVIMDMDHPEAGERHSSL